MGRAQTQGTQIGPQQVTEYLRHSGYDDATVITLHPLGSEEQDSLKSYGYGKPLRATFKSGGQTRDLVFRTMSPDPFGHNRRSARAESLILAFDTFNEIPQHIRAIDVGAFTADGTMLPMGTGELFLVTNFVDGDIYAKDLFCLRGVTEPKAHDIDRARALGTYLVELHREKKDGVHYARAIRDALGSGEGIFGLCDSYPEDSRVAPPQRLRDLEINLIRWRWKLRNLTHRTVRTHGDFHPFNILFRDGTDFSVLDCSRGAVGEAADDLTCLSINYLFFALTQHGEFIGPLRQLWDTFWDAYLNGSKDDEVLDVVAPFFTWRALVLASPVWYPDISDQVRDQLFTFAERLLDNEPFTPGDVDTLLR